MQNFSNSNIGINYDVYSKVIGKSCVSDQIRDIIFGLNPNTPNIFIEDPKIAAGDQADPDLY